MLFTPGSHAAGALKTGLCVADVCVSNLIHTASHRLNLRPQGQTWPTWTPPTQGAHGLTQNHAGAPLPTHTHVHTHVHTCAHGHTGTYTGTRVHTHAHGHVCSHRHTRTYTARCLLSAHPDGLFVSCKDTIRRDSATCRLDGSSHTSLTPSRWPRNPGLEHLSWPRESALTRESVQGTWPG